MFTPDVREVSVRTTASSVTATWRLHPAAESVLVARRDDRPPKGPGDGTTVMASATDFTDTGLRTGVRYCYWIAAVYRARAAGAGMQRDGSSPLCPNLPPKP